MGCLPYFKLYAGDWTLGVLGLSLAERGAYITFLTWSWEHGPLPLSDTGRAKLLGVNGKEFQGIWETLAPLWREGPKGYTNKRLESERKAARKRSANASASASARWT